LLSYSQDTVEDATAGDLATVWNSDIVRSAINVGGIYYHGGTSSFFLHEHADEFGQLFTSCPDILASGPWEDMLEELKRGTGVWFNE